jgi:thiamine pyrophosphate-dependent acetolactate synthase large subunit-like protein
MPGTFDVPMNVSPNAKTVEKTAKMLVEAKSPIFNVGPEVYQSGGQKELVELRRAARHSDFERGSCAQVFPNQHPLYIGMMRGQVRYPQTWTSL